MIESFSIDHLPNRTIRHGGRDYLFFSGTAYLGLPQHPAFGQLLIEAIGRYGTAYGSSRNGNLRLDVYEKAEANLSDMVSAPNGQPAAALTVSSGMMAGQLIVNYLRSQGATFLYGPQTHPALWTDASVVLPQMSFVDWATEIVDQVRRLPATDSPTVILMNSIDAAHSAYFDFSWVADLPDDRPITLVVDDSHGLGVLGAGRGIWPQLPRKSNVRTIVTASMAKALGLPGGVVFADVKTLADLRQTAFFGACSPVPPAYLEAFLRAGALYAEGRNRLAENLKLAEALLLPTGLFNHAKGYPIFFTEHDDLYAFLLEQGIFIYSFAYPTPTDRANTRLVISAFHTLDDIQTLANAVYAYTF